MVRFKFVHLYVLPLLGVLAVSGCTTGSLVSQSPSSKDVYAESDDNQNTKILKNQARISDNGIFSSGKEDKSGAKIGINALLWRASLDTVSFMPLASADPFGGVILTDWYSDPGTPKERFKLTIYILDKRLRADALRVSFFRQVKKGNRWVDATVAANSARSIEDQILTRARQLRIAQAADK